MKPLLQNPEPAAAPGFALEEAVAFSGAVASSRSSRKQFASMFHGHRWENDGKGLSKHDHDISWHDMIADGHWMIWMDMDENGTQNPSSSLQNDYIWFNKLKHIMHPLPSRDLFSKHSHWPLLVAAMDTVSLCAFGTGAPTTLKGCTSEECQKSIEKQQKAGQLRCAMAQFLIHLIYFPCGLHWIALEHAGFQPTVHENLTELDRPLGR